MFCSVKASSNLGMQRMWDQSQEKEDTFRGCQDKVTNFKVVEDWGRKTGQLNSNASWG